jgi:hypothetical protein
MKQTVEEAARDAIHAHYKCNGEYPCGERDYCEHCNGHNTAFDCCECGADEFKEGFISGAEWQSKQSPWISVNERLPEESGYYFITDGAVVEKVYFFKKWNKFAEIEEYPHLFYDEGVIKAWFPIPSFDEILESNRDVLERIKD